MIFWKILFYPFSLLYGLITGMRNFFFNIGLFKSYAIPGKSITVGNLSMGGTGKTPHSLYLWELLKPTHEIAFLSRGYGRETSGLIEVDDEHNSSQVGDEPLMFKKIAKSDSLVVVSENRKNGVDYIRKKSKDAVIILDDAFQHRKVKAGLSILLTDYSLPYCADAILPIGSLREWKIGKNRADCLVVTKAPVDLPEEKRQKMKKRLAFKNENVFFSSIVYGDLIPFGKVQTDFKNVLLVTGIAQPKPLVEYLKQFYKVTSMPFPDHHEFTEQDINKILAKFDTFVAEDTIIVTTEKDYVRLEPLLTKVDKQYYPWYYQAISLKIDREEEFKTIIKKYVDTI
jgi:tetraacyldisaccharide 4'-kinase